VIVAPPEHLDDSIHRARKKFLLTNLRAAVDFLSRKEVTLHGKTEEKEKRHQESRQEEGSQEEEEGLQKGLLGEFADQAVQVSVLLA
jgi:hypothetical protein